MLLPSLVLKAAQLTNPLFNKLFKNIKNQPIGWFFCDYILPYKKAAALKEHHGFQPEYILLN